MKSKQTSLRDVSMIAHGTAVHKRGHFGGEGGMRERLKCFTADTAVPPMQVPVQKALFSSSTKCLRRQVYLCTG